MASVQMAKPENIGVINPFALDEIKLKRRVDWDMVAGHRKFVQTVLGFPYDKLFDPQHGSPLYAGLRYDSHKKILKRDESIPDLPTLLSRIRENDEIALRRAQQAAPVNNGLTQDISLTRIRQILPIPFRVDCLTAISSLL